ncbi:MAG TPA: glycosyltransferase [Patescibacteria group bacterium]|nr:glycosyltransferase [Patescibacteria group bacterium]
MKISVIIPVYNQTTFLPQALDSIIAQTYSDWEAIIIDDGSEIDIYSAISFYLSDSRFHYYHWEKNIGVSAARNFGVAQATGEYLAFLDSDDYWLPEKLTKQILMLQSFPAAAVYSDALFIQENCSLFKKSLKQQYGLKSLPSGRLYCHLLEHNLITTSSMVVSKKIFTTLGGFDTNLSQAEEWDLWLKISKTNSITVVDEPLVVYRVRSRGLHLNNSAMARANEYIIDKNFCDNDLTCLSRRKALSNCYLNIAVANLIRFDRGETFKYLIKSLRLFPLRPIALLMFASLILPNYFISQLLKFRDRLN